MKEFKVIIPEDVVNDIQLKDMTVQSMRSVIASLLEMHAEDVDAKLVNSPVFEEYHRRMAEAQNEFAKAKDAMIVKYVTEDDRKIMMNWNLDYNSRLLVCALNVN